jgi:hypothetical protein
MKIPSRPVNHLVILEPVSEIFRVALDLIKKQKGQEELEIIYCSTPEQAANEIREASPCVVGFSIETMAGAAAAINFMRSIADKMDAKEIKVIAVNKVSTPALTKLLDKVKISVVVTEPVPTRTLMFKLLLQIKAVDLVRKQLELKAKQEEKSSFDGSRKDGQEEQQDAIRFSLGGRKDKDLKKTFGQADETAPNPAVQEIGGLDLLEASAGGLVSLPPSVTQPPAELAKGIFGKNSTADSSEVLEESSSAEAREKNPLKKISPIDPNQPVAESEQDLPGGAIFSGEKQQLDPKKSAGQPGGEQKPEAALSPGFAPSPRPDGATEEAAEREVARNQKGEVEKKRLDSAISDLSARLSEQPDSAVNQDPRAILSNPENKVKPAAGKTAVRNLKRVSPPADGGLEALAKSVESFDPELASPGKISEIAQTNEVEHEPSGRGDLSIDQPSPKAPSEARKVLDGSEDQAPKTTESMEVPSALSGREKKSGTTSLYREKSKRLLGRAKNIGKEELPEEISETEENSLDLNPQDARPDSDIDGAKGENPAALPVGERATAQKMNHTGGQNDPDFEIDSSVQSAELKVPFYKALESRKSKLPRVGRKVEVPEREGAEINADERDNTWSEVSDLAQEKRKGSLRNRLSDLEEEFEEESEKKSAGEKASGYEPMRRRKDELLTDGVGSWVGAGPYFFLVNQAIATSQMETVASFLPLWVFSGPRPRNAGKFWEFDSSSLAKVSEEHSLPPPVVEYLKKLLKAVRARAQAEKEKSATKDSSGVSDSALAQAKGGSRTLGKGASEFEAEQGNVSYPREKKSNDKRNTSDLKPSPGVNQGEDSAVLAESISNRTSPEKGEPAQTIEERSRKPAGPSGEAKEPMQHEDEIGAENRLADYGKEKKRWPEPKKLEIAPPTPPRAKLETSIGRISNFFKEAKTQGMNLAAVASARLDRLKRGREAPAAGEEGKKEEAEKKNRAFFADEREDSVGPREMSTLGEDEEKATPYSNLEPKDRGDAKAPTATSPARNATHGEEGPPATNHFVKVADPATRKTPPTLRLLRSSIPKVSSLENFPSVETIAELMRPAEPNNSEPLTRAQQIALSLALNDRRKPSRSRAEDLARRLVMLTAQHDETKVAKAFHLFATKVRANFPGLQVSVILAEGQGGLSVVDAENFALGDNLVSIRKQPEKYWTTFRADSPEGKGLGLLVFPEEDRALAPEEISFLNECFDFGKEILSAA